MGIHFGNKKFTVINHTPKIVDKLHGKIEVLETALSEHTYKLTIISFNEAIDSYYSPGALIQIPTLEKEGYVLKGFSFAENGEVFDLTDFTIDEDITLYAIWEEENNDYEIPEEAEHVYVCNFNDFTIQNDKLVAYNGTDEFVTLPSTYSKEVATQTLEGVFISQSNSWVLSSFRNCEQVVVKVGDTLRTFVTGQSISINSDCTLVSFKFVEGSPVTSVRSYVRYFTYPLLCNGVVYDDYTTFSNYLMQVMYTETSYDFTGSAEVTTYKEGTDYYLTEVSSGVFNNKTIKGIEISEHINKLNPQFFSSNCSNIIDLRVSPLNKTYKTPNNCNAIIERNTNVLVKGCSTTILPDYITEIGNYALQYSYYLKGLKLPDTVTKIGAYAFINCPELDYIELPAGLVSIGSEAFNQCPALREIYNYSSINIQMGSTENGYIGNYAGLILKNQSRDESKIFEENNVMYYKISDTEYAAMYIIDETQTSYTFNTKTVSLGGRIFDSNTNLTSLDLSYLTNLKTIGGCAFEWCSKLTSLILPEGLTWAGDYAFAYLNALTKLSVPSTLEYVGKYAFSSVPSTCYTVYNNANYLGNSSNKYVVLLSLNSTTISTVSIHNNCNIVYNDALKNLSNLTTLTFPSNLKMIGEYTGYQCTALKTINIPESVKYIGYYAFYNCTNLSDISLDLSNVERIGSYVFSNCLGVKSLIFGKNLTDLPSSAFNGCAEVSSITVHAENPIFYVVNNCIINRLTKTLLFGCWNSTIPTTEDIEIINSYAFNHKNLTGVITIPETVHTVSANAFGYTKITGLIINKNFATSITNNIPFVGSTELEILEVHPDNANYYSKDNCIIEKGKKLLALIGKNATVPNDGSVTILGRYSFAANAVTPLIIPEGVISTEISCFAGAPYLKEVHLPDSLTTLELSAFSECSSLEKVVIGANIKELPVSCFYNCTKLNSITLKANCVVNWTSSSTIPTTISKIYVPSALVNEYKNSTVWSSFSDKIEAIDDTDYLDSPLVGY